MLSRALILAAVAFALGCFGAIPADAQNLEAGKPPSQIFSSTCSLCHKSARGLLKSVAPGSLPSFLRQHYTTSSDMAGAMSAYVLSNGAANAAPGGGNLTRQGQEAKGGRPGQEPGPEQAAKGRKPPTQEAARPDADGLQTGTPDSQAQTARQKAAAERRAARQAAREAAKAGKDGLPPKIEARHEGDSLPTNQLLITSSCVSTTTFGNFLCIWFRSINANIPDTYRISHPINHHINSVSINHLSHERRSCPRKKDRGRRDWCSNTKKRS